MSNEISRILKLAGVRLDEAYGSTSDAEAMKKHHPGFMSVDDSNGKTFKRGNFWKGVHPKHVDNECENDEMMDEDEDFYPSDAASTEQVTLVISKEAAEWLKDHLSTEECEGSCEEVQDALEEALCPECDEDDVDADAEASDDLEDDLGLDESDDSSSSSKLAPGLIYATTWCWGDKVIIRPADCRENGGLWGNQYLPMYRPDGERLADYCARRGEQKATLLTVANLSLESAALLGGAAERIAAAVVREMAEYAAIEAALDGGANHVQVAHQ